MEPGRKENMPPGCPEMNPSEVGLKVLSPLARRGAMKGQTLAIIGVGKVGTAMGALLQSAGYTVAAVADLSDEALERAARYTGARPFKDTAEAAAMADTVFITTMDDAIRPTCEYLAGRKVLGAGKRVIHTSGAGGLELLESARQTGSAIASIHPLQTFPDPESGIRSIPGSTFAITAQDEIRDWASGLVSDLGGVPFFVSDEDKPLYHTAACFASNYLVSLMHIVLSLYKTLGLNGKDALPAVWPLVQGTISNVEKQGPDASLTGPIARGDASTIEKHLRVLAEKAPEFLVLYKELGRVALSIALTSGTISGKKAKELERLLKGDEHHE